MHIVLAKTPVYVRDNKQLDICSVASGGIYLLAALARNHGWTVTMADPATWDESLERWQDGLRDWIGPDPDVIGFSANTFNWALTRKVVCEVRRQMPKTKVIVGGVHPTHFPEHVLRTTGADYVVAGEADQTFTMLLDALAGNGNVSRIPGVSYWAGDQPAISEATGVASTYDYPVPAYDLMPVGAYPVLPAETSRGCAGNCTFCSITSRRRWHPFPIDEAIERLEESIELAQGRITSNNIYLTDDCMTIDRKRAIELCGRLVNLKRKSRFALEARVNDLLDTSLLDALRDLDPAFIQVGVECGYERGLKLVNKKTTIDKIRLCAELVADHGLSTMTQFSFIVGLPWEDETDCLKTLKFAFEMAQRCGIQINTSWWLPLPSYLWEHRSDYGITLGDDIFDTIGFARETDVFWSVRPGLNFESKRRIDERLRAYAAAGVPLRVTRAPS